MLYLILITNSNILNNLKTKATIKMTSIAEQLFEPFLTKKHAALVLMNIQDSYKDIDIIKRIEHYFSYCQGISDGMGWEEVSDRQKDQFINKVFRLMCDPNYLCEVLKDQFYSSVLRIKHRGMSIKTLLGEWTHNLWWMTFDVNRLLQFTRRSWRCDSYLKVGLKIFSPWRQFMERVAPYFYQIAPDTQTGELFNEVKKAITLGEHNKGEGKIFPSIMEYNTEELTIYIQKKHLTDRIVNNRIKGDKDTDKELAHFFNNYYYITPNGMAGTHFNYNFDLKKNVLVWDAHQSQYKFERVRNYFNESRAGRLNSYNDKTWSGQVSVEERKEYIRRNAIIFHLFKSDVTIAEGKAPGGRVWDVGTEAGGGINSLREYVSDDDSFGESESDSDF